MDRFDDAGTDAERCERILCEYRSDQSASESESEDVRKISKTRGRIIIEGRNGGGFLVTRGNHPKNPQEFSTAS